MCTRGAGGATGKYFHDKKVVNADKWKRLKYPLFGGVRFRFDWGEMKRPSMSVNLMWERICERDTTISLLKVFGRA